MNLLSSIFDWLVTASFRASLLVPVVLALQWLMRKHIGARAQYALWLPVLLVLLMPVLPQSEWSMENLLVKQELPPITAPKPPEPGADVVSKSLVVPDVQPQEHREVSIDWAAVRMGAWAAMSAALLLVAGVSFLRTLRRYRVTSTPLSEEWRAEIDQAAREVGLRRAPRVWCSAAVTSPAVTGLLRPVLLLPASFEQDFTPAEARLIVRHELMHLKRRDLPLNALLCVLMALHWFNPLLWLAFWKVRADREAACDAQVLENAPQQRRIEYGHALLKAETAFVPLRLSLGFVGLFQRGSALRSRIQSIAIHRPSHPVMKFITITCIALMSFFGVTSAAPDEEKPQIVLEAKIIELNSHANQPHSEDEMLSKAFADLPTNQKDGKSPLSSLNEFLEASQSTDAARKNSVIVVLDDPQFQMVMRNLSQKKGVDLMSAPTLTTHDGRKATIEVSRSLGPLPGEKEEDSDQKVGVTLEMLPKLTKASSLVLTLDPKVVEFDGFVEDAQGAKKPLFNVRSSHARVALESGQTALIEIGLRRDSQQVEDIDAQGKTVARTDHYSRRAIAFVTARIVKPKPANDAAKGYSIGKSAFQKGDQITITNVQRGSGFLTVTADYHLASTEAAKLSLLVTSLTSSKPVRTDVRQIVEVSKGSGTVTLHHPDLPEGLPHLSFYDLKTRKAIGGIYFGTEAEAKRSMTMNLDYMLEGAVAKDKPEDATEAATKKLRAARPQRYDFNKANLSDVLRFLATDAGLKFIALSEDNAIGKRLITFSLEASPFEVLETISHANGLALILDGVTWHVRELNDKTLSGRSYPNPRKDLTETALKDIRRILDIPEDAQTKPDEPAADDKPNVIYKDADNTFNVRANSTQHKWVAGYLQGLGRGK